MQEVAEEEEARPGLWRSVLAAAAGNVLEWYDFTVYADMAPYIAEKICPQDDPRTGLLGCSPLSAWDLSFGHWAGS
jgi:hypothetical protein